MKAIKKENLQFKSYLKDFGTNHTFVIYDEDNWNCYLCGKLLTKTRNGKLTWY